MVGDHGHEGRGDQIKQLSGSIEPYFVFCARVRLVVSNCNFTENMSKYRIVMVRHGESEWNKLNLFCGWYDADLSDKGT